MHRYKILLFLIISMFLWQPTNIYSYSWEKVTNISPSNGDWFYNYWLDIYFLPSNPSYGWICGMQGKVLRTTNGGASWTGVKIPNADKFESVHFANAFVGYVSGEAGIYKTTDGGATWSNITPNGSSGLTNLWGNYFLNPDYGMVIGGGCSSYQRFWLTTDGGQSWTVALDSVYNSGLTDLILYPNGSGYATSSGYLWQTLDSGRTWALYNNSSGTEVWQEELTHIGSTFCLPYSGNSCTGNGSGGGIRYTHSSGVAWSEHEVGAHLYGSFLLSEQEMWACGLDTSVYYSNTGGSSWEKLNCGIESGNLDDIRFVAPNQGWVVGHDVYRFGPNKVELSQDSIYFGDDCYPGEYYDTVYVENISFDMNLFNFTIEGANQYDFALDIPSPSMSLAPCQMIVLPIRFTPSTPGTKLARIKVLQDGAAFYVQLVGKTYESTVSTEDTLLIIPNAKCGETTSRTLSFFSRDLQDSILGLEKIYSHIEISESNEIPIEFYGNPGELTFSATPSDTGWISAQYRVYFDICNHDTTITVLAYGISPIIESAPRMDFKQDCLEESIQKIEVQNNGNINLIIDEAFLLSTPSDFEIIGWTSGSELPVYIKPGEVDTLIVRYFAQSQLGESNKVRLINNDFTTARGTKNVYDIALIADVARTNVLAAEQILDFGRLCLGDSLTLETNIYNLGSQSASIFVDQIVGDDYDFKFATASNRIELRANDSNKIIVKFKPTTDGLQNGYILLLNEQCTDTLRIEITGFGVNSELSYDPTGINELVQRHQILEKDYKVTNTGNSSVTIKSLEALPAFADMNFTYTPTGDQKLEPGEFVDYKLSFQFTVDTTYIGEICVVADAECEIESCIPIEIKSHSLSLVFDPGNIEFDDVFCTNKKQTVQFTISNVGVSNDMITRIELEDENQRISLDKLPTLPYNIAPDEVIEFDVIFDPITPAEYSTRLVIESDNMYGDIQNFDLKGNFYKTSTSIDISEFDFGEFEVCDQGDSRIITLTNSGNYDDTLKITKVNNIAGITIVPDDLIYVDAGKSATLTVEFDPSKMSVVDKYEELITVVSQICPRLLEIKAAFEIIDPELTIDPEAINFGSVWIKEDSTKILKITNNSTRSIEVTDYVFQPQEPLLEVLDSPVGLYLPNDTKTIRVRFNGDEEKVINTDLVFSEKTSCEGTSKVPITGDVPHEEYDITVTMGTYYRNNDEPVILELLLQNSSPYIKANEILYKLNFNPYLFVPLEMYADTMISSNKIDFVETLGSMEARIPEQFASTLLTKDKFIIYLLGKAYADPDDSTDLVIEKFEITSPKEINVTKVDGKLVVEPHCSAQIGFRLVERPEVEGTFDNYITDDDLVMNITASADTEAFFRITDYMGRTNSSKLYKLKKGDNQVQLDVSRLSSGYYFLRMQAEFVQIFDYKFIIVR
jgi:photosystem II stability/assembly factor-like uncharacterized protein